MNKPRILLVDDDEGTRLSGRYALEEWYDITCVETTARAFELLTKDKFNLVLLDVKIENEGPESGIIALGIISKKYPGLPVVMLTGTVTWMQKWDELKQRGAAGYLGKPFERTKAKEIVERCLKGEKMDRAW